MHTPNGNARPNDLPELTHDLERDQYTGAQRVGHYACGAAVVGGLIAIAAEVAEAKLSWGPMPKILEINAVLQTANAGGFINVLRIGPDKPKKP